MKNHIKCPYCEGEMTLDQEVLDIFFRGESYSAPRNFYKCKCTAEGFTTTEQDDQFLSIIYDNYREDHEIPFPKDIQSIRLQYELTQAEMALLFGTNYVWLEEGLDVPTSEVSEKLKLLRDDPKVFVISYFATLNVAENIAKSIFDKLKKSI